MRQSTCTGGALHGHDDAWSWVDSSRSLIDDVGARAVVPDCAALRVGIHGRNCLWAQAAWAGDLVAFGRAYRYPGGPRRDDEPAARPFRLDRREPEARRRGAEAATRISLSRPVVEK